MFYPQKLNDVKQKLDAEIKNKQEELKALEWLDNTLPKYTRKTLDNWLKKFIKDQSPMISRQQDEDYRDENGDWKTKKITVEFEKYKIWIDKQFSTNVKLYAYTGNGWERDRIDITIWIDSIHELTTKNITELESLKQNTKKAIQGKKDYLKELTTYQKTLPALFAEYNKLNKALDDFTTKYNYTLIRILSGKE